ncbi:potassium channel family protein [Alteripontixanthobacter muriae]|uniref:potassium channel family protein n=1 Tax=Alteripontixanthobacter muriae TaxID=2705546 RepID=UPI001E38BCDD|nr:potassium channel family protein [Alteripontixanthobacter muriae]
MLALVTLMVGFHWWERESLRDQIDGHVSFVDVIYFTMISATTTGYGDIVPITDGARLFDALFVTPARIFFILILAGTAYTFVLKRIWSRWVMRIIQSRLHDHIVLAGFGVSNKKALEELIAQGCDPQRIVVIDQDHDAIERASDYGAAVLRGDATDDETLRSVHVERASAVLISAGRDDTSILVVLTARKLAPHAKISVTIRHGGNEDTAQQAGADTIINPVNFAGLLLASSLQGPHRAEYLIDLATTEGRVMLRERVVEPHEVGVPISEISTGQAVRLIREGKPHGPRDPTFAVLQPGDRVLEIVDSI